jgi:hypothetical protein
LHYFVKDFLFFFFNLKEFCVRTETKRINLDRLREIFLEKFKNSISDNFVRAYNLIKTIEKNIEKGSNNVNNSINTNNNIIITTNTNNSLERENMINVNIIKHLEQYIKQMSLSYSDLKEEFGQDLLNNDELLILLGKVFSDSLLTNYFNNIIDKTENLLKVLQQTQLGQEKDTSFSVSIIKFYLYHYILSIMNDVFVSFQISNIGFLINDNIQQTIEKAKERFMTGFYNSFLNKIEKQIKMVFVDKEL